MSNLLIPIPSPIPSASFTLRVALGNEGLWRLRFNWRDRPSAALPDDPAQQPERAGYWYADLLADDGTVLCAGSRVLPGSALFWPVAGEGVPGGMFYAVAEDDATTPPLRDDLGARVSLRYVLAEEAA